MNSKHITIINEVGLKVLKGFESLSLVVYLCPAGVPTIGWGTTRYPNGVRVTMKDKPITEKQAEEYLLHDVNVFERGVDSITRDDITQNMFSALVLFAYNIGLSGLKGSTLLKKVNRNPNDLTIQDEFTKWIYADGKRSKGLLNRRNSESKLYYL